MTTLPLVSIILPVYNAQTFIGEAINSVINQTYNNWELIIINDGSTDQSVSIIKQFDDCRITNYEQQNKGVSAARNLGLKHIKGKYLCFLDADDVMPPLAIESRLSLFMSDPLLNFVDGKVIFYDSNLTIKLKSFQPTFSGNPLKELVYLSGKCFIGQTWMIKVVPNMSPFDTNIKHGEDLMFYIQNAINNELYGFTNEVVLYYRQSQNSAMTNLAGLEKGYELIANELKKMPQIPLEWVKFFKSKTRIILFKSYLKKGHVLNSLRILLKK